jgi:hypothetical protein
VFRHHHSRPIAAFKDYGDELAPGEVGTLMVIAADRRQARVIFSYVNAFFEVPLLARLVASRTKESLALTNRTAIEIHTCSLKATRGYTLIGVVADEVAFWRAEDSAKRPTASAARSTVSGSLREGLGVPADRARSAYWSNSVIQRRRDFSGSLNGVESLF